MGYYEDVAKCKTEKELLTLWKLKEPVTKVYINNKHERTISINHKNVFISDGVVNEIIWNNQDGKKILYVLKEAYALADKDEIKKQISIINPDIIVCGSTFSALNHVYDDKIRPEGV